MKADISIEPFKPNHFLFIFVFCYLPLTILYSGQFRLSFTQRGDDFHDVDESYFINDVLEIYSDSTGKMQTSDLPFYHYSSATINTFNIKQTNNMTALWHGMLLVGNVFL